MRQPFTQHYAVAMPGDVPLVGSAPYFQMPNPQAPPFRPASLPPIVAPARGIFGYRKTALPPQANPSWFVRSTGASALTYGPGGSG